MPNWMVSFGLAAVPLAVMVALRAWTIWAAMVEPVMARTGSEAL